jgi:hypothetical protein
VRLVDRAGFKPTWLNFKGSGNQVSLFTTASLAGPRGPEPLAVNFSDSGNPCLGVGPVGFGPT